MSDYKSWAVVFSCEDAGQGITKTFSNFTANLECCQRYYSATINDNKNDNFYIDEPHLIYVCPPLHVYGNVDYEFQSTGNRYYMTVNIVPCSQSSTGYCITLVATGDTLGDEPVYCQNY